MFECGIVKFICSLVANLAVALIALYFAFVKFRVEKWWDKKFQCYMEVVELLNGMLKVADEIIQFNNGENHLGMV